MSYLYFETFTNWLYLRKLDAYGFSTSSIDLIQSYFTDRNYRVKIGAETTSEWKKVLRGCPQSSTFGPLLWNTFENDLNISANEQNLMMYADDHQLHSAGQTVKEVQDALNTEVKVISKWYESNLLKDNYEHRAKGQNRRFGDDNVKCKNKV